MQYAKTLTLWGANPYNMENTDYNAGPMSEAPHTDEEKNKLIGNLIRSLRQAKYRMSDTLEIQTGTFEEPTGSNSNDTTIKTSSDSTNKGGCLSAVAIVFTAATGAIISALFL